MTGDLADFVSRLRAVLPKRWFADESPNLTAILTSIATPWVWLYSLITYVICQTRIATATDGWLDLISNDYFGSALSRKPNEPDFSYRARIQRALLHEAATRSAVAIGLQDLTGIEPVIFEPAKCSDTGAYGAGTSGVATEYLGMAYGSTGGWGSLELPLQFFITATRPIGAGLGNLAGYGTPNGAYGGGVISYVDLASLPGQISDADIQTTLCGLLPVNAVAWLRIL